MLRNHKDVELIIADVITTAVFYGKGQEANNRRSTDKTITDETIDLKGNDFLNAFKKLEMKYPDLVFDDFSAMVEEHDRNNAD